MLVRFYSGMSAAEPAGAKTASWNAAARPLAGHSRPYRSQLRREERQAKTKRAVVVCSLFLVLLVMGLLVGGRTLIDPMLEKAAADRQANRRVGDVVFAMPDGRFCRHLSFDNTTAEVVEGGVQQCVVDRTTGSVNRTTSFKWGAR